MVGTRKRKTRILTLNIDARKVYISKRHDKLILFNKETAYVTTNRGETWDEKTTKEARALVSKWHLESIGVSNL